MTPIEIVKRGVGCLSLLITFIVGLLAGFCLFWIDDNWTPLIDQQTALRYALEYSKDFCNRTIQPHPVDCAHYRVTSVQENKDGWMFGLVSADKRRSVFMIVSRKGDTEAEDPVDLDDPRTWPSDRPPVIL